MVVVVANAVIWTLRPYADETLRSVADEADFQVGVWLTFLDQRPADGTLRGYEPYRGLEPWSFVNGQGLQCLLIGSRSQRLAMTTQCMPPGVDLSADVVAIPRWNDDFAEGLTPGSMIRFHLRGDSVDVVFYPAPETDPSQP
ncbi:hypothetical protein [Microbacterium sp. 2FI]|uniref:hypothetical protein n=1 Tax=Microbacterium sp. 2FI TaxID=2502193 RepID=UPI0010F70F46|nr:hypothetical protein [Microbacterium sp. 2FI]